MSKREALSKIVELKIANENNLCRESYPELQNVSSAFIFQFIPEPIEKKPPEYIYLRTSSENDEDFRLRNLISQWNLAWEAGHLRYDLFVDELPAALLWLEKYQKHNIYLIPEASFHHYDAYLPLFHLLPLQTLKRFGLPALKRGGWPHTMQKWTLDEILPRDFDERLSQAFAFHVWPLLNNRSYIDAFSESEPIKILAHNMDFWLPYVNIVIEDRLRGFPRIEYDDSDQSQLHQEVQKESPVNLRINRPLKGGTIWVGEDEAQDVTCEMIKIADSNGKLQGIIDAVKSNRIEDDFSGRWSYEKEDFERKVYRKRAKVKVTFVELDNTIPVHGFNSELSENLLWEDFFALLNQKERHIVVCLRNGITKLGEIGEILGYANHSPVSKALKKIREKALQYLEF